MTDLVSPAIVPMAETHIESFHRALDTVARERKYLAFLEAPPLPRTRDFVLGMIEKRNPQFVAVLFRTKSSAGAISRAMNGRRAHMAVCSAWGSSMPIATAVSERD